MNIDNNNISLNFRSHDGNHNTELDVNISADNVNDEKLTGLLNTYLSSIGSALRIQV